MAVLGERLDGARSELHAAAQSHAAHAMSEHRARTEVWKRGRCEKSKAIVRTRTCLELAVERSARFRQAILNRQNCAGSLPGPGAVRPASQ